MDRFSLETASDLAANYARRRFAEEIANSTYHPDGYKCQNCGKIVDRLTPVPEFNYMGCDDCMEEALAVIAHEALPATFEAAGVTREEGEAFLAWIDRKPVQVVKLQGELFPNFNPEVA